ncbi:MAG: GNAT family N-acetyltransferase [Pseudomonadota bacterium]
MSPAAFDWRPMEKADVPDVIQVAAQIHTDYPEADEIFMERQGLFPAGCLIFSHGGSTAGYLLSHPWHFAQPPELDTLLQDIPAAPTTYYIHDLALLPDARGTGAAHKAVEAACTIAVHESLATISLVAVGGSNPFWKAMGFADHAGPALTEKLKSYDEDAAFMVKRL